ncbi:hypothetical protein Tco_1474458 [Tanacetum coccineum]
MTQAQQRNYMMNYIKHMGIHTLQQLKRYSFDELKELFETTMKNVNTFVPMETEDRGRASELAVGSSQATITNSAEVGSSKRGAEVGLDHEVPVEEVYVEALQVKYPIIDWEVYSEDTRRDDLVKLWDLVKERFSTTEPINNKEKELWVELKRLFEPDSDDTLWKLQSFSKGHDIFMLVEKDYTLSKGVQMLMLVNKLWFNSEKLVDLDDNHKFRQGLLGFKPITLSTAKGRVYTAKLRAATLSNEWGFCLLRSSSQIWIVTGRGFLPEPLDGSIPSQNLREHDLYGCLNGRSHDLEPTGRNLGSDTIIVTPLSEKEAETS